LLQPLFFFSHLIDNIGSDGRTLHLDFAKVEGAVLGLNRIVDLASPASLGRTLKQGAVLNDLSDVDTALFPDKGAIVQNRVLERQPHHHVESDKGGEGLFLEAIPLNGDSVRHDVLQIESYVVVADAELTFL
jgi:hypothetical protein